MKLPPDPEEMNDARAEWAGAAIDAFAVITNMAFAGEDDETILSDLLADLHHWCDRNGVNFATCCARAEHHYEAETNG